MTVKEQLYRLIDELPEHELPTAQRLLEELRDRCRSPLRRTLMEAPWDDEPETEDERAAVQEARDQAARGELISDEELWRRLGHEPRR